MRFDTAGTRERYVFVTFAFTSDGGGRWNTSSCKTALTFMYSSLVRSQKDYPELHLYSNDPGVVPQLTTMQTAPRIVLHEIQARSLPRNEYSETDEWRALSLAKLDAVEQVMKNYKVRAIWVDLDTLIFIDLKSSLRRASSWVIGYQSGSCGGLYKNCSYEHVARGGFHGGDIEPALDTYGDLWSLSLETIDTIRQYRKQYLKNGSTLPLYDLQGYMTFMLMDGVLDVTFLHDIVPYNFGFFCSNFEFPNAKNLEIAVLDDHLVCPMREFVPMSTRVGAISFTAITFQQLVLDTSSRFQFIPDESARKWLSDWFYSDYTEH